MTDRLTALTVVLEKPIRADDAERLIQAIEMLQGVLRVEPEVQAPGAYAERVRVSAEWRERFWAMLEQERKDSQ